MIFAPIELPVPEIAVSARSHMPSLRATAFGGRGAGVVRGRIGGREALDHVGHVSSDRVSSCDR